MFSVSHNVSVIVGERGIVFVVDNPADPALSVRIPLAGIKALRDHVENRIARIKIIRGMFRLGLVEAKNVDDCYTTLVEVSRNLPL